MAKSGTKTVDVEIPELGDLPLDESTAQQLDALCLAVRSVQGQIKGLEETKATVMGDLKPLAESLDLPERVLGAGWDLRRTVRVTEKLNLDRLKMTLLQSGWTLDQVKGLLESCTDHSESTSWSVYERKGENGPLHKPGSP